MRNPGLDFVRSVASLCQGAEFEIRAGHLAVLQRNQLSSLFGSLGILQLFRGLNPVVNDYLPTMVVLIACGGTTYAAAYLLHRFWERPFLAYREIGQFRLSWLLRDRHTSIAS